MNLLIRYCFHSELIIRNETEQNTRKKRENAIQNASTDKRKKEIGEEKITNKSDLIRINVGTVNSIFVDYRVE